MSLLTATRATETRDFVFQETVKTVLKYIAHHTLVTWSRRKYLVTEKMITSGIFLLTSDITFHKTTTAFSSMN